MTIGEILAGESKTIEFKEKLPENSSKYMKTVAAFANGRGGKLVFGVEDETRKIVGINKDIVFKTIDAITNSVSDSIEPMIIPDITLQEIDGKTIIVVEILQGNQRPYYIKYLGIKKGTFVRSAGTTRLAEPYMIQELILEGTNGSFDQLPAEGQIVTEDEIKKFCSEITDYARKMCTSDAERVKVRPLTLNQLFSWGLLIEKDGELLPSNGFCLLAGKTIPSLQPVVQCAVFKGTNRSTFVDRKTYEGPIQSQIDEAYNFVLRMIRMGARIEGLYRQDVYEFPIGTVREMICNAVCHRSYLEPANVQIALYDDRLEVTSPGMLLGGVSIKKMKEGYSKIRNRGIANAFNYMNIIESWGSGIPRMMQECEEYGLQKPELIDFDGDFRINLYRNEKINADNMFIDTKKVPDTVVKVPDTTKKMPDIAKKVPDTAVKVPDTTKKMPDSRSMKKQQKKIIEFINSNGSITSAQAEGVLEIKQRRARAILSDMVKEGLLKKQGTARNTIYVLFK